MTSIYEILRRTVKNLRFYTSLSGHTNDVKPPKFVAHSNWVNYLSSPSGAVTGKVMDSALAARLSFIGRAGHPCGAGFPAAPFLAAHPEFAWQKPVLHDMIAGPWTVFTASEKAPASAKEIGLDDQTVTTRSE